MFKKYIFLTVYFLSLISCAQSTVTLYSKQQNIAPKISIPLAADILVTNAANDFNTKFKTITGQLLQIERSNSLNKNNNYILLRINPTQRDAFCVYKRDRNITIQATNAQNLQYAISDFFKRYTSLTYNLLENITEEVNIDEEIKIPEVFNHCTSPTFSYREPYFSNNFNPNFRHWNKTNYLELEWGIWGHNLPKILNEYKLPETAYAKVGKKRVASQFCFTSDSLLKFTKERVQQIYDSDHALNKFMILPNDNEIVCTCSTCSALGNTSKDAAPAVFNFLNKLAKTNRKATFFTAAYTTVKKIPREKAEKNTGVFYSTIAIQKGIPIAKSNYSRTFETTINKWKNYVPNVYIWDYTVNYDNYFDFYPSLKVTQENLRLYRKLGINGVFLHGSEYNYSTLENLKVKVLSKLLWNPNIDVNKEVSGYFNDRYSKKLASVLSNYYNFITEAFYRSNKELSIYSGIHQTAKKYLDPKVFFSFYKEFETHVQANKFNKDFLKLATALTFLKLEIMRDYGFGVYGFANLNAANEIIVKNSVGDLLNNLTAFSKSSKLYQYNEIGFSLEDYITSWRKSMYRNHKKKNYFYKKPFTILSKIDEDYKNTKILNDGAFGLKDYNTNWHIASVDNLILKINKISIENSSKIIFNFLQDQSHNIFFPSSIEIFDEQFKSIKKLTLDKDETQIGTKEITLNLPNTFDKKDLPEIFIIKINKSKRQGKNALACDEIIFN
ncbi:MAG: DUF4838 domain-containing protein [Polaribacter sp.]